MSRKRRVGVAGLMAALVCMLFVPAAHAAAKPALVELDFFRSCSVLSQRDTCQFIATGLYSDGSTQDVTNVVTWSSSDCGVVKVSNGSPAAGLVSAIDSGSATITATLQRITASASVTVGPRIALVTIEVLPSTSTLGVGATQQFTAIGV
jgi:hypothetical protein